MFIASRTRCLSWAAMSNHAKYFPTLGNGARPKFRIGGEMLDGYGRGRTICPDCPDFVLKSRGSAKPIDTPCPDRPDLPRPFLTCTG